MIRILLCAAFNAHGKEGYMKTLKDILKIAGVIIVIAAAVAAVIVFRDQICDFIEELKSKCCSKTAPYTDEEYSDFADV